MCAEATVVAGLPGVIQGGAQDPVTASERPQGRDTPAGWVDIVYGPFWDIPRMFVVRYRGRLFLFDGSQFDGQRDEYVPEFEVFELSELPPVAAVPFPPGYPGGRLRGTPLELRSCATRPLGRVAADRTMFDATLRRHVREDVLRQIGQEFGLW